MTTIDLATAAEPKLQELLQDEQVIWLTTTSKDGTPQPRPIWFIWDDDSVLMYSQPDTPKLAHIARNPRVALHFNSDRGGGQTYVLLGSAAIDDRAPKADDHAVYLEKYHDGLASIGYTPERFSTEYSVAVRVHPTKIRGY